MLRSTARLLVIVMLFASGRLLACGLECLDELAMPDHASCHPEAAPATALSSGETHACLPEVAEPQVTVAKLTAAQTMLTAPVVTAFVTSEQLPDVADHRFYSRRPGSASPPASASSVLRI